MGGQRAALFAQIDRVAAEKRACSWHSPVCTAASCPDCQQASASSEAMCACGRELAGLKTYGESLSLEDQSPFVRVTKHGISGCVDGFHRWAPTLSLREVFTGELRRILGKGE